MKSQQPNPPGALYDRDMWVIYDHDYAEREGLPRLLDLFDEQGVKATFVTNGRRVELSPALAREVQRRGHDMGSENYLHEYPIMYTPDQERDSLVNTVEAFRNVLGAPPTGYISPGHRPTPNTLSLLMELGFRWYADFQNEDGPFIVSNSDRPFVGMPYAHISDYHCYALSGRTPRQVLEMLWDEFRVLRREGLAGKPRIMGYAIHPFLCHGFRAAVVEDFLEGLRKCPDVWIATRTEIANWVWEHPGDLPCRGVDDVLSLFPHDTAPA